MRRSMLNLVNQEDYEEVIKMLVGAHPQERGNTLSFIFSINPSLSIKSITMKNTISLLDHDDADLLYQQIINLTSASKYIKDQKARMIMSDAIYKLLQTFGDNNLENVDPRLHTNRLIQLIMGE